MPVQPAVVSSWPQDLKQLPDGSMRVVARGQQRFQVTAAEGEGSLLRCTVQLLKEEASPKEAPKVRRS